MGGGAHGMMYVFLQLSTVLKHIPEHFVFTSNAQPSYHSKLFMVVLSHITGKTARANNYLS